MMHAPARPAAMGIAPVRLSCQGYPQCRNRMGGHPATKCSFPVGPCKAKHCLKYFPCRLTSRQWGNPPRVGSSAGFGIHVNSLRRRCTRMTKPFKRGSSPGRARDALQRSGSFEPDQKNGAAERRAPGT
jgi:hypothetical protein